MSVGLPANRSGLLGFLCVNRGLGVGFERIDWFFRRMSSYPVITGVSGYDRQTLGGRNHEGYTKRRDY